MAKDSDTEECTRDNANQTLGTTSNAFLDAVKQAEAFNDSTLFEDYRSVDGEVIARAFEKNLNNLIILADSYKNSNPKLASLVSVPIGAIVGAIGANLIHKGDTPYGVAALFMGVAIAIVPPVVFTRRRKKIRHAVKTTLERHYNHDNEANDIVNTHEPSAETPQPRS